MPPRVTVIIPTYNWSEVLPYSIGSVLAQTFDDFELLVIGDGCTDDSESVVHAISDSRVRWINIPRVGHQCGANNEGLRQARGEFIAYLGHDDLWLPHHLELGVAALDSGADLTHSLLLSVGPEGKRHVVVPVAAGWKPPTCVLHRRTMTDRLGGWPHFTTVSLSPEHDLWLRAQRAGARFHFIQRLTGVKFPASQRRDVYRERPSHEQKWWSEHIRHNPRLEVEELAREVISTHRAPSFFSKLLRLVAEPHQWWAVLRQGNGDRIRARRRYKGVS
jgi:glycosyltransferase involved in cell wall biosynthesis